MAFRILEVIQVVERKLRPVPRAKCQDVASALWKRLRSRQPLIVGARVFRPRPTKVIKEDAPSVGRLVEEDRLAASEAYPAVAK